MIFLNFDWLNVSQPIEFEIVLKVLNPTIGLKITNLPSNNKYIYTYVIKLYVYIYIYFDLKRSNDHNKREREEGDMKVRVCVPP